MIVRRYKEIKNQLARVAGSTGMNPSGPAVLELINRVTEELINEGEWPGITDRYRATIIAGWFVLPDEFVSVDAITIDESDHDVKNPWFEFAAYGPGVQSDARKTLSSGALDRGLSSVFHNIPDAGGPWVLRVRSDRAEDQGLVVEVHGWDDRGKRIVDLRTGKEGHTIPLPTSRSTWGESDQLISRVDTSPGGVILPKGRKGELTLSAWDGTNDVILAQYLPGVEIPQYRRYFVPGLTTGIDHNVIVKASKRFRPITGDDDILQINNLPALELMILALRSKDNDKVEEYLGKKQFAVRELEKEASRYNGPAHVVVKASVDFGFGFNGVR